MNVPLLDLRAQYQSIRAEVMAALEAVCDEQAFILGARVADLEKDIQKYVGVSQAVGVASGTDAILLALMACGVGAGDEVVTVPYTFFATAGSISRLGAKPVFVDIKPDTYNMDPALLEGTVTARTKGGLTVQRVKLKHLEEWTKGRQRNAARYETLFKQSNLLDRVTLPTVTAENRHVYNQYVIQVQQRDQLRTFLQDRGVGTEIYYPSPLHFQ